MSSITARLCSDPQPGRIEAAEALRRRLPPPRLDERGDVRSAEYQALLRDYGRALHGVMPCEDESPPPDTALRPDNIAGQNSCAAGPGACGI